MLWLKELQLLFSFAVSFVSRRIPFWGGDNREQGLQEHVLERSERGNAESVLHCMDEYAKAGTWFMSIGDRKGAILDDAVTRRNPLAVLELGTYCGYSAVRIASQLQQQDSKLFSIEVNPRYAAVGEKIIDHAGLSSKVEVLQGTLENFIQDLKSKLNSMNRQSFDFVFIDHGKFFYLPDYLLLKDNRLVDEGSVIFADNMKFPGSPSFWNYLQTAPELETEYRETNVEYLNSIPDTVTISTFHHLCQVE